MEKWIYNKLKLFPKNLRTLDVTDLEVNMIIKFTDYI